MDLGKFVEFNKEVCLDFLKNSDSHQIVLYGGSQAILNFFAETMKENFVSRRKNIDLVIDEKIGGDYAKEKYPGSFLINVDSLLDSYNLR